MLISSVGALTANKAECTYSGSKSALSASLKSLSKEISKAGNIRINAVMPSMIKTPMTVGENSQTSFVEGINDIYPLGWGEPSDVANMIVYLLSDKARFLSGQNYVIDTGGVML